jgi:ABC-2 type transport system ATP-binding protein
MVIEVEGLVKRYGEVVAVDRLSFEVMRGEIFGLLGPNGAGKTTTIRILLDILQPDQGLVSVLGRSPNRAKDQVGYLPEERGLYRNLRVLDTLIYLAELKGLSRPVAHERAVGLLERLELTDWMTNKVGDLSRGMRQRLQFAASMVHDPLVLFLDEPFQGLDPINVERIKRLIAELHGQGKTVVLSTHQMNMVEALCDRILLIHRGRGVLYGPLAEIKGRYAPHAIRVEADRIPSGIGGVKAVARDDGAFDLTLEDGVRPDDVLRGLLDLGVSIRAFEVSPVPLEDIFVTVVSQEV